MHRRKRCWVRVCSLFLLLEKMGRNRRNNLKKPRARRTRRDSERKTNAQTKSDHAAQGRPKRAPTLAQALQQAPRGPIRYPRRSLRVLQGFALACGSPQYHRVTPRGKTRNPKEQEPHFVSVQGFALDTRSHPTALLYRQEGRAAGPGNRFAGLFDGGSLWQCSKNEPNRAFLRFFQRV
jgi:hypothetical protein